MLSTKKLIYLLWGAPVLNKIGYAVIILFAESPPEKPEHYLRFLAVFGVLGVMSAIAGWLFSRQIYTNQKFYTSKLPLIIYAAGKPLPDDDWDKRLLIYSLIGLGMAETCAIFGLVGSLITGNHTFFYAMTAISLMSWLLQFPRYREFETKVKPAQLP